MKKTGMYLGILALLLVSVLSSVEAVAAIPAIVNGHVYYAGGHVGAANVPVTVSCNGNVASRNTNVQGYYAITVPCAAGSVVTSCVQDGLHCKSARVMNFGGYLLAYINLECTQGITGLCY